MKRFTVFFASIVAMFILMMGCAFATSYELEADDENDIINAIAETSPGDEISIELIGDIEITRNIEIKKSISVSIYFSGYQLNYTGNASDSFSYAGLYLNNANAKLNLYGSNRLESHSAYTHYADSVKPDMTGTGNLIVILNGELNIHNTYMLSSANAFAILGDMVDDNDYTINIENSVLRAPQGSSRSAMAHEGGNSSGNNLIKRVVVAKASVLYGGFKGINYAYNLTTGTSFTDVKFYDFYIKNDCWYNAQSSSILPCLMNSFEKAAEYKNCSFNNYDETIGDITIYTETGKQNFKLIGCTFGSIVSGGVFKGDQGGDAFVYIIDKMPTCVEAGVMRVCKNGGALYEEAIPMGEHVYGKSFPSYPNGYSKTGVYTHSCTLCTHSEQYGECEPLFVSLGYSINEERTNVSQSTYVNWELIDEFLINNPNENFDFGVLAGTKSTTFELADGKVNVKNGIQFSLINAFKFTRVDVKMLNIASELKSTKLALEFYICDGESVEICDGSFEYISIEDLEIALDEVRNAVIELLDTKHKLYYNDDGSFRVLILADAHMNASGDAANVQEVKDRIKTLVDKVDPNLVIFTGDNTISSSSEERLRTNIDALVGYIEEKQIPWCHVYGNHDHEGALSNAEQQPIFESYEYCVSKTGPSDISGTGNYALGVYNKDGTLGSVVYCLDSGAYASSGGYDYIKEDQIAWYKQSSLLLEEYYGAKVPAIMAFHIPLIENNDAHNNRDNKEIVYEYTGNKNENICSSATDTTLLETIFERGDVKAIVTGHDHINDYMYNYKGVKLCSSPNISDLTYYDSAVQGARVFDLSTSTIDNVPTYVEYIIERVNPDDFETLAPDTPLVDAEDKITVSFAGYNGGSMNGTVTITAADNAGANGTGAIEVVRSTSGNFEFYIDLGKENYGKLGSNKYLIVWVDFTNVDFRKACFGLISNDGASSPYRTDDHDLKSPFYYLADGTSEWVELSHGTDGCFGNGDNGSQAMKGKKGYLALPIEYFKESSRTMNADTLVTGVYMYADVNSGAGSPFYLDNIYIVEDYKTVVLPNE